MTKTSAGGEHYPDCDRINERYGIILSVWICIAPKWDISDRLERRSQPLYIFFGGGKLITVPMIGFLELLIVGRQPLDLGALTNRAMLNTGVRHFGCCVRTGHVDYLLKRMRSVTTKPMPSIIITPP